MSMALLEEEKKRKKDSQVLTSSGKDTTDDSPTLGGVKEIPFDEDEERRKGELAIELRLKELEAVDAFTRKKNIWDSNAEKRRAYEESGRKGKKPVYEDPGDGDLFGSGPVKKDPEPWMPVDRNNKDKDGNPLAYERGKGGKLSYDDAVRNPSGRFSFEFDTDEYKKRWLSNYMDDAGYGGAWEGGVRYINARRRAEAAFRSHRSEMQKKASEFLHNEYQEQMKGGASAGGQANGDPVPSLDQQVVNTERAGAAKAAAAAASPVIDRYGHVIIDKSDLPKVQTGGLVFNELESFTPGVAVTQSAMNTPENRPTEGGETGKYNFFRTDFTTVSGDGVSVVGAESKAGYDVLSEGRNRVDRGYSVTAGPMSDTALSNTVRNIAAINRRKERESRPAPSAVAGSSGRRMKDGSIFFGDDRTRRQMEGLI